LRMPGSSSGGILNRRSMGPDHTTRNSGLTSY
jgi:hypothetical protein